MTKWKVSPLVFVFAAAMLYMRRGMVLVGYFVAVVMHEMAHAEVAKRRGYALSEFKIMPYGASLTGSFEGANYKDEFFIAIAGPLCNIVLAVLVTALWWLVPETYFFTEAFAFSNVFTALTNLLPVFPLDGGRALLAIISRKLPRQKVYKSIRLFGYVICAIFLTLFILSYFRGLNITFAMMAIFVLSATLFPDKHSQYQRLYSMAYRSEKLKHGLAVREIMVADTLTLHALGKMLNGNYYHKFTVVNERLETVAVLTETDLEHCLTVYPRMTVLSQLPTSVFCEIGKDR